MNRAALFLTPVVTLCLAGCSEYVERKETVSSSAGNAVHTNMMAHIIDPWPAHAQRTRIEHDGERMQRAVERYRMSQDSRTPSATTAASSSPK